MNLRQGSLTVEAAFLVPMAVLLTAMLIFYCFSEHGSVWYRAAACEAALAGTQKSVSGENTESLARERAWQRIQEQPFPLLQPSMEVTAEGKSVTVSYESTDRQGFARVFPFTVQETVTESDPVVAVRTAWLAREIISGG